MALGVAREESLASVRMQYDCVLHGLQSTPTEGFHAWKATLGLDGTSNHRYDGSKPVLAVHFDACRIHSYRTEYGVLAPRYFSGRASRIRALVECAVPLVPAPTRKAMMVAGICAWRPVSAAVAPAVMQAYWSFDGYRHVRDMDYDLGERIEWDLSGTCSHLSEFMEVG